MGSGQSKRLTAIGINNLNNWTVKKKMHMELLSSERLTLKYLSGWWKKTGHGSSNAIGQYWTYKQM